MSGQKKHADPLLMAGCLIQTHCCEKNDNDDFHFGCSHIGLREPVLSWNTMHTEHRVTYCAYKGSVQTNYVIFSYEGDDFPGETII